MISLMNLILKSPAFSGLFAFILTVGCQPNYPKLVNKPIVQVNEHSLTTKEFAGQLARRLKDLDGFTAKDPQIVRQAKDQIINDFIIKSLVTDWARTKNISVQESSVDSLVDKYRSHYPDDLSFRRLLAKEHLSFSEWREKLRHSLIEQEVFKKIGEKIRPPGEDEIKKYYAEKKDQFKKKERIYIRQIVVDEMAKAELIKASSKTKDFSGLAQKFSNAPEAKSGGLVGWIEKGTVDFYDELFDLQVGAISQIIKSPFGYHIVKIERKSPPTSATLDEARPGIVRELTAKREQAEFVAWLDKQIRSSKVMKDYDLLNAINVDTRGEDE